MDIAMTLVTPSGLLSLNEAPYRLAAGTFEGEQVTHRRAEVINPFIEGSYVVNAPRDNVVVPVNVWVEAETRAALKAARLTLCAAFSQVAYNAYVTIDGDQEVWACYASDYMVSSPRELLHSTRCRVDVQLIRQPTIGF